MAKMTLKVKVNDTHFQYQPRVSHDACLVKKLVMPATICDEVKLTYILAYIHMYGQTDGQTYRWTDTGNNNTPFGLKDQG